MIPAVMKINPHESSLYISRRPRLTKTQQSDILKLFPSRRIYMFFLPYSRYDTNSLLLWQYIPWIIHMISTLLYFDMIKNR